ncbi:MAG: hypothetical protein L6Q92_14230 [Phycisphaerae bacterium]|nr:hypothetical protein [Phycisphaerae bacterium]
MRRVRVVHPDRMRDMPGVCLMSYLGGICSTFVALFTGTLLDTCLPLANIPLVLTVLFLLELFGCAFMLSCHRPQLVRKKRRFIAGLFFGLGASLTPWTILIPLFTGGPEESSAVTLAALAAEAAMVAFGLASLPIGWALQRWSAQIVFQDGTLCPGCMYSLVGNTSGRCPECGRAYTLDELRVGSAANAANPPTGTGRA